VNKALATIVATLGMLVMLTGSVAANEQDGRGGRGCDEVIFGTLDRDALIGTRCDDIIFGFQGSDLLIGLRGEDRLIGGAGNDLLRDIDGNIDVLIGGGGRDRCAGDVDDIFIGCEFIRRVLFVSPS
jgi:Ca2+-binding RTX toxin-like protein